MSTVRCQGCGTENPAGATLCSGCARPLNSATQQAIAERRAAHTATGVRWSAVIITVVVIVIVAVVVALVLAGII